MGFNTILIEDTKTQIKKCATALQRYSSKNDSRKIKSNTYIYIYYNIYKYKVDFRDRNTLSDNCNTVTA